MEIYLSFELNNRQITRLRKIIDKGSLHIRTNYDDNTEMDPVFTQCEVVFGNVPSGWLEKTSRLRWIQLESVGFGEYRNLDWSELEKQITITNLAGFFADPVAQSTLAGILAHFRGIDRLVRLKHKKEWVGDPIREELRSLTGVAVVLFGYGSINRRLAELLTPFQCHITRFGSSWTPAQLDQALSAADIVVCTAPETNATIGIFNKARLELLKQDALFVNVGRGSIVDEAALAEALENHEMGGAVIDVTMDEPLPDDHPFWTAPHLILTQHSGGGSRDELDRKIDVFAENLARYRAGKPLLSVVDLERGY